MVLRDRSVLGSGESDSEVGKKPVHQPADEFKAGVYEHYKGGLYLALHLARHHDTGELFVFYMCLLNGTLWMREWATPGKDSWTDQISVDIEIDYDMIMRTVVPRFRYVRPAV
jgi:hypothetical protein